MKSISWPVLAFQLGVIITAVAQQPTRVDIERQSTGTEIRYRAPDGKITPLGRARTLTFEGLSGVQFIGTASQNGDITFMVSADTAILLSQKRFQRADNIQCRPFAKLAAEYRCGLIPPYEEYKPGKMLVFWPDVVNIDNPSLNVDGLGQRMLKKHTSSGIINLAARDLLPFTPYLIVMHDDYWLVLPQTWS